MIGGGAGRVRTGQAFARLGSGVTLVASSGRVLPREDAEAATLLRTAFAADGVEVVRETPAMTGFDAMLVAAGRRPNVEGLGLEAAGVASTPKAA